MSKLDRFLISESLLSVFPSLSAICLDRHLSDHRPILMRELVVDYGPTSLAELDKVLDQGNGSDDLVNERSMLLKELQDFNARSSLDMAQKAKIRWFIEGIEKSKYFHGIINRKRSQLAIRGVLVEGDWIDEPSIVKNKFLSHFADRFSSPSLHRITLEAQFPKQISFDQKEDLERSVTYDEIKCAVWDCGSNKSPGQMDLLLNSINDIGSSLIKMW
ncbi:hypothetical protein Tco_1468476 [Tanacetum coccineum]